MKSEKWREEESASAGGVFDQNDHLCQLFNILKHCIVVDLVSIRDDEVEGTCGLEGDDVSPKGLDSSNRSIREVMEAIA